MPGSIENRRSAREDLRVPVKLEVIQSRDSSAKVFLGYTSNVSSHGLALNIPSKAVLNVDAEILIYIDGQSTYRTTRLPAKLLWQTESRCGLEFVKGNDSIQEILKKAAISLEVQPPFLKRFYPYVDGENVDTRNYEFFPYADKFITEYAKIRDLLVQLKKGLIPADTASYFYAQLAIADSHLNRAAILSAHNAFQTYGKFSNQRKRQILMDVRELLHQEKRNLIELLVIEGHPLRIAESEYSGMLASVSEESLDYFENEMEVVARRGLETVIGIRRPCGVVCVSPPRNASSVAFTVCLSLLAGNTLVLKPPLTLPISSVYLWRNVFGAALSANGAPKGTLNIVMGDSGQFMSDWTNSPLVKCIFNFSDGSKSARMRDAMFLWSDAPIDLAADAALDCFMGPTVSYLAPKKILIHERAFDEFMEKFLFKIQGLKPGVPQDMEASLSPAVNETSLFFKGLAEAVQNEGRLLAGGYRINHLGKEDRDGLFIAPTVVQIPMEKADRISSIMEGGISHLLPVVKITGRKGSPRETDLDIYGKMIYIAGLDRERSRPSVWVKDPVYLRKFIDDLSQSESIRVNSSQTGAANFSAANGLFGEMKHVWQKASRLQWISVAKVEAERSQIRYTLEEKD